MSLQRAPLAALDANAQPSPAKSAKRAADDSFSPSKKVCREDSREHSRSTSPDTSSVFDAADASYATTTTEPDLAPPRPRANMTREQAREKAQILRLRLGLANYKVRTGQTDVPLAELKHVNGSKLVAATTPRKTGAATVDASLTNSARRGGAASGLLSLARGESMTHADT